MASVLMYLTYKRGKKEFRSLLNILFQNDLENCQTSNSAKLEYFIFKKDGVECLGKLLNQICHMFDESLTHVQHTYGLKIHELIENGSLSQKFLMNHKEARNVPASNCRNESAIGAFKKFASSTPQMHHANKEGLSTFKHNNTYRWYLDLFSKPTLMTNRIIDVLFSDTYRFGCATRTNDFNDLMNRAFDRQEAQSTANIEKEKRKETQNSKILEKYEIKTIQELESYLSNQSYNKQRNILITQLRIHKIKYKLQNVQWTKNRKAVDNTILKNKLKDSIKSNCNENTSIHSTNSSQQQRSPSSSESIYCICRKSWGNQRGLQCFKCKIWLHCYCIGMTYEQFVYFSSFPFSCDMFGMQCYILESPDPSKINDIFLNSNNNKWLYFAPYNLQLIKDTMIPLNSWDISLNNNTGGGLRNLGNTCFMNSSLQCLAYIPPFVQYFIDVGSKKCNNHKYYEYCVWKDISYLLPKIINLSDNKYYSPNNLFRHLRSISNNLRPGRQEDSHEFFISLLDKIKHCQLVNNKYLRQCFSLQNTTIVDKIFGGFLRSTVQCDICKSKYNRINLFHDISLEIDGNLNNIVDCLNNFTKSEPLTGDNKY